MSVKNVVKVMNFHALLRVDSAKRNAEKYFLMEETLSDMIDNIVNNRNFLLDKKVMVPSEEKPVLDIYIGSDFGFCSNFNSLVNNMIKESLGEEDHDRIIIGKKLHCPYDSMKLRMSREECTDNMEQLRLLLEESVTKRQHREINIIYNRYYNASTINLEKKKIYPLQLEEKDPSEYIDDFVVEGDVNDLLTKMIACYVYYELKICLTNANAAENVLRQNTTSESLKKIDERDELALRRSRKEKRAKEFRKIIENFVKQR